MNMKRTVNLLVIFSLTLLVGCGGGGGGSDDPTPPDPGSNYQTHYGALAIGDLMQVKYDLEAFDVAGGSLVPFKWEVLEGLKKGSKGSVQLMKGTGNLCLTYETHLPVIIYPGGIVISTPQANELGMYMGLPQLKGEHNVSDIEGIYNFVECSGARDLSLLDYSNSYGTFQVEDGVWKMANADLSQPNVVPTMTGTWIDQGNGIMHALNENGDKIANMFIHPEVAGNPNSNLLIIDVCDAQNNLFGIRVGTRQAVIGLEHAIGDYDGISTFEKSTVNIDIKASGEIFISEPITIENVTLNSPWNGFMETKGFVLLSTGETGSMLFVSNNDPQKSPYFISAILSNK